MYTVSEPYIYEYDSENETSISAFDCHEVIDVTVSGEYKIQDYTFVAALEFDSESGRNIISGDAVPEKFLTRCECDHCKTARRRR
jgi:hypothetical protein